MSYTRQRHILGVESASGRRVRVRTDKLNISPEAAADVLRQSMYVTDVVIWRDGTLFVSYGRRPSQLMQQEILTLLWTHRKAGIE